MATKTKSRLGRGLSALMAQPVKVSPEPQQNQSPAETPDKPQAETQAKSPSPAQTKPPAPQVKTDANTDTASKAASTTSSAKASTSAAPSTKTAKPTPAATAKATAKSKPQPEAKKTHPQADKQQASPAKAAPAATDTATNETDASETDTVEGGISWLSPRVICPNQHQPRRTFDEGALATLAASIKSSGLMQPIIVRPAKPGSSHTYELVAGERRWRAVQMAGLQTIPAIVRDLDENQSAEWALVENLQREDLNPMERAEAFAHLISKFNLSHEQIAHRVGVERSTISNLLRFIDLESQVKDWVRQGRLSAGQARALAGVTDKTQQKALAQKAIAQEMSVRAVEAAVRQLSQDEETNTTGGPLKSKARAAHLADLEQQISQQLETKVRIRAGRKKGSGTMSIDFYSVDQFDTLLKRLAVDAE